ncbi:MAG: PocR ligand-binding domain-containing protein [Bacteroidales bacterium]
MMEKNMGTIDDIQFSDLFDLEDIQHIQDLFSDATGVASIITHPDGRPITHPSNFCRLCNEIIRKTDLGLTNCFKSDAEIGRPNPSGPVIQPCLSGGLWDAGASIMVDGKHIANWLIGQVKNEELNPQQMLQYAKEIGADQEDFMDALKEVPIMSKEKFEKVAQMLFAFASEISSKAYQNSQLIQSILERKQAEEKLIQEQYLSNALLNNLPDRIYFKDRESRFIRINKSLAFSFGLDDPALAVGKTDFDYFTEEHARQAYEDELTIISTGLSVIKEERETWADREDTWVHTTKVPLHDKDGRIGGTFGISRDITEHKLAEEALSKEQYLMHTLMDNLPDHIYFKDSESRFIRINKALAQFLGLNDPVQAVGKTDFDFFTGEHAQQAFDDEQNIIRTGQLLSTEEKETHHNRPDTWVSTIKLPMHDKKRNINGTFGISRDITEHKLAEEEIKLKNELLQTINAEKDKFFSILAHDLKGPLSAFLGATQILIEEIQTMTLEEIKEITVSMKESATNIYGLLENLLEWSRLKRGIMDFKPETFNLKQNITASIEVLKESARKKKITISYSLPEDLTIYADSHMFNTVIRNLVSNAIKFTPKSGEISISTVAKKDNIVEVKICDTGIGISKELINKLFQLNEKTNRKGTEGEPSTGLGLLLCKEFIEKHGGKIWVESEVGKGSVFIFTISGVSNN